MTDLDFKFNKWEITLEDKEVLYQLESKADRCLWKTKDDNFSNILDIFGVGFKLDEEFGRKREKGSIYKHTLQVCTDILLRKDFKPSTLNSAIERFCMFYYPEVSKKKLETLTLILEDPILRNHSLIGAAVLIYYCGQQEIIKGDNMDSIMFGYVLANAFLEKVGTNNIFYNPGFNDNGLMLYAPPAFSLNDWVKYFLKACGGKIEE